MARPQGLLPLALSLPNPVNRAEPLGKHDSLVLALSFGGIDVGLGLLSESLLGVLAFAAVLIGMVVLVVQVGQRPRPFRWIAWCCLELSLAAVAMANVAILAVRSIGC